MTKRINLLRSGLILATLTIMSIPFFASADTLTRELSQGMSGSDVSALQSFLAQDTSVYPQGLVTGYFGPLTFSAVSNFQAKNGIATVGRVGPITLAEINRQMATGSSGSAYIGDGAPNLSVVNVNVSRNSATVSWTTNELAKGIVYYSTSPLSTYERLHSVDVGGNTAIMDSVFHTQQNVPLTNLLPNTTYYYLVYATDQGNNVTITWSTFQTTN